jgi:hypothetical protein
MTTTRVDEATLRRAACEAALLLNEAVRELVIPNQIHQLTERYEDGKVKIAWLGAMRHTAMQTIIIGLWRVHEARTQFLVPWLFSDEELRDLGVPSMDQFLGGTFKSFELVRHQYVGHATARRAKKGRPGQIIAPDVLGCALHDTGLLESKAFLTRVQNDLVPGIERARQDLVRRYPEAETYLKETYPIALESAVIEQKALRR